MSVQIGSGGRTNYKSTGIAGLIPYSLQLHSHVILVKLG